MESIIKLGNEEVRLKANAITAHHYKNQFKSDVLKDTLNALGGIETVMQLRNLEDVNDYQKLQTMLDGIDTVLIHQLVWSFAKTADRNFLPFYQWVESVDLPPVTELLLEENFVELLIGNVYRKK
ncbi:hypothetical protein [Lederbergia lenta]|uniref:hypothetical protein n=1 Tax=Lederbergia lenta TaxID=1467 RepID=UPI0020425F87|nr:hypothetical protein [Lederbergia lenta]MCM3111684.1 hypothetical protein [Lederbergia lenta]